MARRKQLTLPDFSKAPLKLEKETWIFHRKMSYWDISIKKKFNQS